jgi:DNA polymerase II small subunit
LSEDRKIQEAVTLSLSAGYQLDKDAFDFLGTLAKTENPLKLIEAVLEKLGKLEEKPLVLSRALLEEAARIAAPELMDTKAVKDLSEPALSSKSSQRFCAQAKGISSDLRILEDPTDRICSSGSVEDYLGYFQDRFRRLTRILRQRMDTKSAVSIKDSFRAAAGTELKVICMITDRRETKHGTLLRVEDLEDDAVALVPSNAPEELLRRLKMLLLDQVVCLGLLKSKRSMLIVKEVVLPDIPQGKPRRAKEPVYAALISDLHVGSKEFMKEEFNRFVLWLNGKHGSDEALAVAEQVKYVVIAGDIVDVVGVYPNQAKELVIRDIFKQYRLAAEFIEQIPDYVEVVIIPGNHDASRRALPQPAIPKRYSKPLCESRHLVSLGNPAVVSLHGVEFLVYHGRSLDDVLAMAADMNFHSPERAMRILLQSRHLAPTYGQRTLIAPEQRDFLVIERVPDVFHAGHVHVMKHEIYRGTLMVNSGAWQRQTGYQRNLGLDPTPGIFPVVNLQTLNVLSMDFT